MKLIIRIVFVLFIVSFFACSSAKVEKEAKDKSMILGKVSWEDWKKNAGWSTYDAKDYDFDDFLINQIKQSAQSTKYNFILFGGSWCDDSKSEMPKIIKILEKAQIFEWLEIVGVDKDKKEDSGIAEKYKIQKVPTLIIIKNGVELHRIVEFPMKTWEEQILVNLK